MKSDFVDGFGIARLVAAAMLVLALADLPYGYYTLLRIAVCAVGAYGAYLAYSAGRHGWTWTFGAIAVLFNPIIPVYLDRETWAPIDVGVGLLLLASLPAFRDKAQRDVEPSSVGDSDRKD